MTYYGQDLSQLTHAVAQLLHDGAAGATPLADPEPTLAARDAVVAAIRTTYDVINHISDDEARGIKVSADPVGHPVHATAAALRALAPVAGGHVAPSDVVRRTEPAWAAATAAAVSDSVGRGGRWR